MNNVLKWISSGLNIGAVGAGIAFVFSAFQFLSVRKRESRQKEFDQYHSLIEKLVAPSHKEGLFLDQQVAVVFELRNFPRYFECTERILAGLKTAWTSTPGWEKRERLIQELVMTLSYIKNYQRTLWRTPLLWWRK